MTIQRVIVTLLLMVSITPILLVSLLARITRIYSLGSYHHFSSSTREEAVFNDTHSPASELSGPGKLLLEVTKGMQQQVLWESNKTYSEEEEESLIKAVGYAFDAEQDEVCFSGGCRRTQGILWCEGCPAAHYFCLGCASGQVDCTRSCCYKCLQ